MSLPFILNHEGPHAEHVAAHHVLDQRIPASSAIMGEFQL